MISHSLITPKSVEITWYGNFKNTKFNLIAGNKQNN